MVEFIGWQRAEELARTEPVIQDVVGRIAASRNVRYAAIGRAEDRWPPPWA
jgi:hypothetical protein